MTEDHDPTVIREWLNPDDVDVKPVAATWSAETDQGDLLTVTFLKPDGSNFKSVLISVSEGMLNLWVHDDVKEICIAEELTF